MILKCGWCKTEKVVPGQRGKVKLFECGKLRCRMDALLKLEEHDLLTNEEQAELDAAREGR